MTKSKMISELINKYQYPVNRNRSVTFIAKVLRRMRGRKKMYQKDIRKEMRQHD